MIMFHFICLNFFRSQRELTPGTASEKNWENLKNGGLIQRLKFCVHNLENFSFQQKSATAQLAPKALCRPYKTFDPEFKLRLNYEKNKDTQSCCRNHHKANFHQFLESLLRVPTFPIGVITPNNKFKNVAIQKRVNRVL